MSPVANVKRPIRIAFTRTELVDLLYALEDLIEGYGRKDYHLIEDEDKLRERLQEVLYRHDGVKPWRKPEPTRTRATQ